MDFPRLQNVLREHHQDHLLRHWDSLSESEKAALYQDLMETDFSEMNLIFKASTHQEENEPGRSIDDLMEPIEDEICASVIRSGESDLKRYCQTSMEAISKDQVGVLLLAGGQGTRLGVAYPKGMYNIGLPTGKSLYQIQCERILRLEKLASVSTGQYGRIMMYIMTSEHTKRPTEEFFEKHNYFNLRRDQVIFFEQRMIPCFDMEGKIILETKSKIARAPDGNGGLYWALKHENVLSHMKDHCVKYLHVYCVDNVLVKVADPMFMGCCIDKGAESGNKVVEKAFPTEAVGVVCKVDGRFQVVEYSEIGQQNAESRRTDGKLTYYAGNICNHFFTTDFLDKVCHLFNHMLPYHVAKKKIPFFNDSTNKTETPSTNNGIKLEKFVFDVFQFSDNFVVWECLREEEFSPLKNADGAVQDTPLTARNALFALHSSYVVRSGGRFLQGPKNTKGEELDCVCEISPLLSYAGENLEMVVKDKEFKSPLVLTEE